LSKTAKNDRKKLFQFLMVRLKEPYYNLIQLHLAISIPYGAIKSSALLDT